MSDHAGYAAVVILRESLINEVLARYHAGGVFPAALQRSTTTTLDGIPLLGGLSAPVTVDFDLFMHSPVLKLLADNSNRVAADLVLRGSVSVTCPELEDLVDFELALTLRFATTVLATPVATAVEGGYQIGLDYSDAEVTFLDIKTIAGEQLEPEHAKMLQSQGIRDVFSQAIRGIEPMQAVISPEILNKIGSFDPRTTRPHIQVLDGALAVAVDAPGLTAGDPAQIVDFAGPYNMAACTHPRIIMDVFNSFKPMILGSQGSGVSVRTASFGLGRDSLHVSGKAYYEYLSDTVDYSLRAALKLDPDKVLLDVYETTINLPWWVTLLGVVLGVISLGLGGIIGWIAFIILGAVLSAVVRWVEGMVEGTVEKAARGARTHLFDLPGFPEGMHVKCSVRLEDVHLGSDGLRLLSTLESRAVQPYVVGAKSLRTKERLVHYSLFLPEGFAHPADPDLKIRWDVEQYVGPEGTPVERQQILCQDRLYNDPTSRRITFQNNPNARSYKVHVLVYAHTADGGTTALFKQTVEVRNTDRLDRSHRFVRWEKVAIYTPPPLDRRYGLSVLAVPRTSAIHVTAIPGRCRFADEYSERARLEYMDVLPFGSAEIEEHRAELCPYCFFGGPGKKDLVVDLDPPAGG